MAIVVTRSRGGGKAILLGARVHELADEFGEQIEFRKELWEAYAPPELVVTIVGAVAGAIVGRLIDKLFEKKEDTKNVTIQIIHQDFGIVFNLPEDSQECVEHFKRREENREPTSSASG